MFFKKGVLKNLAIFARKHLCWSLILIKLQTWRPAFLLKQRHQHRYFPVNIAKLLRTIFLKNTFCSLYFSEILSDDRILWTSLGTKLIFFVFFVPLLWFFHNSIVRIGSPWLFCACIYIKIFSKFNFCTLYNVTIRNNIQNYSDFSQ